MLIVVKMKMAMLAGAITAPILATAFAPAPSDAPGGAVRLASTSFSYRAAGDFSRNNRPVEGPLRQLSLSSDLIIMKRQVTVADYARCVDEGACPKVLLSGGEPDLPIVGVNWHDANAYAAWMSHKTGFTYRLPTDEEWTFAAAERARDQALALVDRSDPAQAWISRYDAEAAREQPAAKAPQPGGSFGTNSKGVDDLAGNVWEWTESCFIRASLNNGRERITNANCGVRIVEGAHRAYMTDFIRDPKSGGCAAGIPPANLGFRLVIESRPAGTARLARAAATMLRRTSSQPVNN